MSKKAYSFSVPYFPASERVTSLKTPILIFLATGSDSPEGGLLFPGKTGWQRPPGGPLGPLGCLGKFDRLGPRPEKLNEKIFKLKKLNFIKKYYKSLMKIE